jgi:alkanesulfonate monooxygenase SsuD/methylene tetrahydromethanopterin reductase-like flavin-dependent oxidoreductase (luciferase family)
MTGGGVVTLAAIFPPTQPPERIGAVAAAADAAGLAQLWVWEDCFKESGIATATAMLAGTSQVNLAIGLLPCRCATPRSPRWRSPRQAEHQLVDDPGG